MSALVLWIEILSGEKETPEEKTLNISVFSFALVTLRYFKFAAAFTRAAMSTLSCPCDL